MSGHSVLLVPVPALEPFVRARTEHYDRDYVSADPRFVHAHVTALGPFLPPAELTAGGARHVSPRSPLRTAPFDFTLAEVGVFPNGIIHLLPEPSAPFEALTERLWRAFPQCPPYAGEFGAVVPHLTLDAVSDEVTTESTRAARRAPRAGALPGRPARPRVVRTAATAGSCTRGGWDG